MKCFLPFLFFCVSVVEASIWEEQFLGLEFMGTQGAILGQDPFSSVSVPSRFTSANRASTFIGYMQNRFPEEVTEDESLGLASVVFSSKLFRFAPTVAMAFPLGQNTWFDTGSLENNASFWSSRSRSLFLNLSTSYQINEKLTVGAAIPLMFNTGAATELYLKDNDPYSRVRAGIELNHSYVLALSYRWSEKLEMSLVYSERQRARFRLELDGQIDIATLDIALEGMGNSIYFFKPRRLYYQVSGLLNSSWEWGGMVRWSHWSEFGQIGLDYLSSSPEGETAVKMVESRNTFEFSLALAYSFDVGDRVSFSYRYKESPFLGEPALFDSNQDILGLAYYRKLGENLNVSGVLRSHLFREEGLYLWYGLGVGWSS